MEACRIVGIALGVIYSDGFNSCPCPTVCKMIKQSWELPYLLQLHCQYQIFKSSI